MFEDEETQEVFEDALSVMELKVSVEMENGNPAAYRCEDGCYIFKIVGPVYALKNPARNPAVVEGCQELPDGAMVCKGIYWNKVPRAPRWYTPPPPENEHLFRVRYVLCPDITMEDPSDTVNLPTRYRNKKKVLICR